MRALYLTSHCKKIEDLKLNIADMPVPEPKEGQCLVKITAAGVNPSDALGAIGYFSHAKLPRIPGRDFAGKVIKGSAKWIGKLVWGTGGAAGIDFDGTHAEYLVLPESALSEIPKNLSLLQAGAQPLPYVTAYYSLVSRAKISSGETVLVMGALGQVGSAAMSICSWKGCKPIAYVRPERAAEARSLGWRVADSLPPRQSVDVILNSTGNFQWDLLFASLKKFGRMAVIAAREEAREATVNLFQLYRTNQELIGINSVDLDFNENARLLNTLKPGFESNALLPLEPVSYSFEESEAAYNKVLQGSEGKRIVLAIEPIQETAR